MLGWNVANDSVVHVTYADALAMPDRAPLAGKLGCGGRPGLRERVSGRLPCPAGSGDRLLPRSAHDVQPGAGVADGVRRVPGVLDDPAPSRVGAAGGRGRGGCSRRLPPVRVLQPGLPAADGRDRAALRSARARLRSARDGLALARCDDGSDRVGGGGRLLRGGRCVPRPGGRARTRRPRRHAGRLASPAPRAAGGGGRSRLDRNRARVAAYARSRAYGRGRGRETRRRSSPTGATSRGPSTS